MKNDFNNLMKRMIKKGILFGYYDDGSLMGIYENENDYLFHNDKYVVTIHTLYTFYSSDIELIIYDINTLDKIGTQYLWPQRPCEMFNENKWGSFVCNTNEEDEE